MSTKLNPEVEAQKTVNSFREAAEKNTSIDKVWDEMAKDSKEFKQGSAQDKAYFHAVTEGLRKQGLLPEITVAYAQWHKDKMANDDGDVGKNRIDDWALRRKVENGRRCEVEQALLDNLKNTYDDMRKTAKEKTHNTYHKGLDDKDLSVVKDDFAKKRHEKEANDAHEARVSHDAKQLRHAMFDPRKDNGSVLFDKLSSSTKGAYISRESIDEAIRYDDQYREHQYKKGNFHSYLDGADRRNIVLLKQYFDDIAPADKDGNHTSFTKSDLQNYLKKHESK